MQLSLRHRPLQSQHQAVVEISGVIHPVGVGDQRVGDRAQVQQLIPVGVVTGQPRHLNAQHDPHPAQTDIGDQLLEPDPPRGLRPGAAQISIDHHHLMGRPPQQHCPLTQLVLAGQGFGVMNDLRRRRLAHIHIRIPAAVRRGDLLGRQQQRGHRCPRRYLPGHCLSASACGSSARAPRAISRANNPSTWVRVSSGSACQQQAGTGRSPSPRASWHGTATLIARKWVHSPVVVTAIRDEANLLARPPPTPRLRHALPVAAPTGEAPATPQRRAPTAGPAPRHPTRQWHRNGSFPANRRANRSPTTTHRSTA